MQKLTKRNNVKEDILKNIDNIDSWSEIIEVSPVDLSRVYVYAEAFLSNSSTPIMGITIDYTKRKLFESRNNLDLMITSLLQILDDNEFLTFPEDRVLFMWLKDDLGRFLQSLDTSENMKIVTFDDPRVKFSTVGISRIAVYTKEMNNAYSAIYESILRAVKEYYKFDEKKFDGKKQKITREKKTFLFILFHVLSLTMSVLGSITRQSESRTGKKGIVGAMPTTWSTMMSDSGRKQVREQYKEVTGKELIIPEELLEREVEVSDGDEDA